MPPTRVERDAVLEELGARIFESVKRRRAVELVFDDATLRSLLSTEAASRYAMVNDTSRSRLGGDPDTARTLAGAQFGGICVQDARLEPANTTIGLRRPGWVIGRALVLAVAPGGRRLAWWVEGTFVFTDLGFGAVNIERLESPRWEHSDLDLASCDMAVGMSGHNL